MPAGALKTTYWAESCSLLIQDSSGESSHKALYTLSTRCSVAFSIRRSQLRRLILSSWSVSRRSCSRISAHYPPCIRHRNNVVRPYYSSAHPIATRGFMLRQSRPSVRPSVCHSCALSSRSYKSFYTVSQKSSHLKTLRNFVKS